MAQYKNNFSEQLVKPEKLPVGWPWRIFVFSVMFLLAAILSYFGLRFGYSSYLTSKIKSIDANLETLTGEISIKDRNDFINSYSQLVNLKNILDKHMFVSKIFPLLEKVTNQKVYYTTLDFKLTERKLILEGLTDSYGTLGEQLASFDGEPMIERYNLDQSQIADNLIKFKVSLILSRNLLVLK